MSQSRTRCTAITISLHCTQTSTTQLKPIFDEYEAGCRAEEEASEVPSVSQSAVSTKDISKGNGTAAAKVGFGLEACDIVLALVLLSPIYPPALRSLFIPRLDHSLAPSQ